MKRRHGPLPQPRLDFGPVAHAAARMDAPALDGRARRRGLSELARRLGIPRETLARWKNHGVTLAGAEMVADLEGRHPAEMWGDDYWHAVDVLGDHGIAGIPLGTRHKAGRSA